MKGKRLLGAFTFLLYAFLYLPLTVMVVFSFNDVKRNVLWKSFTFRWYGAVFRNPDLLAALGTSLEVAAASCLLVTVLGTLASYVLACHPGFRGKRVYSTALNVPLMMPEIVLGVSLLSFFVWIRFPLSFLSLVCAHTVFCLPYMVGSVRARFMALKTGNYEDAAMDLGATEWQAFKKVTLPLAGPAIFSGALLAFTLSFEDFVTSFFVAGVGTVTFPIKIYSMMKYGITPEINALSTLLLLATVTALGLHHVLTEKRDVSR